MNVSDISTIKTNLRGLWWVFSALAETKKALQTQGFLFSG